MIIILKFLLLTPYMAWVTLKVTMINLLLRIGPNTVAEQRRYKFARRLARLTCWLLNIKVVPHHRQHWVDGAVMLVANHQSSYDGFLLLALNDFKRVAPCAVIVKDELRRHRLLRYFLTLINLILIKRNSLRLLPQYLATATELIKIPRSLVLFAEGTRSHGAGVQPFRGFFLRVAQKTYSPVVPVAIINAFQINPWS